MPKKKWKMPKLIVLLRGRPEEGVLQACKAGGSEGPDSGYSNCYGDPCVQCYGGGGS